VQAVALAALFLNGAAVAGQEPAPAPAPSYASAAPIRVVPNFPRNVRNAVGTMTGRAADSLSKPFTDYVVVVRDVQTGGILAKQTIDSLGNYMVFGLAPSRFVVVELRNVRGGGVLWTGGPYVISADRATNLAVNVGYGSQMASWVMTAAADVPTVVPLAIRSGSR
jgi:hypothetical protein